jgi:type I restriction enzyme S subunit
MKWEKVKLADITEYITDGDHQPAPKTEDGILFIKIKDIQNNQVVFDDALFVPPEYYAHLPKNRKAVNGDTLYTVVGSYGIPAFISHDIPFCFERNIALLHPNTKIVPKFLFYAVKNPEFYRQVDNVANGSAQKLIPLSKLSNMEIAIPSIDKQESIVSILSAYDDLIENNQKQIKLLEEAAQRLYKEWFVDLRFPGYENTPITDGVPQGWKKANVNDVCDTIGGGTPSTKNDDYYRNGHIKWVTPTDITRKNSLILLDTEKRITEEGLRNSSAKMLPPYTILMTSRASVGFFGLCEYEVCTNQGFISCVPYKENLRFFLLYNLMERVDEIRSKASGSTFLEISKKNFRELGIILPPDDILDLFSKIVTPIVSQIEIHTKSIKELQEARDRLLPKLMSGELEV